MNRKGKWWRKLAIFELTVLVSCVALFWIAGCSRGAQSDQQIRQQAAQTTEQVKTGAKKAAAEARVAAAEAKRKAGDIAAGVREGLHSDNSSNSGAIDINSASEARLATLPGVSAARARKIVRNRPYNAPRDLVSKGILSRAEYGRIAGQLVAREH
ncbi:MAG: helix-hairpin-helix domain-containing protein [Acidobacteriaceae bacterium]